MAQPDPQTPDESGPSNSSETNSQSPDYFNDPHATERAWQEIVSELSDLSTDQANVETARTDQAEVDLDFPKAPWVDRDLQPDAVTRGGSTSQPSGPRDWADSTPLLDEVDAFTPPDPEFSLSSDPARNLGWFLTGLSMVGFLLATVVFKPAHTPTLAILGGLFVCGVALLIWRLPKHRDLDSHDGAQV